MRENVVQGKCFICNLFLPCRAAILEPAPLAVVLFLLFSQENCLALSGKNGTLQEFLLSASTALGQHTPAGHYPTISAEQNHCRDSLRYTWSQEIALLAAVLN